MANNLYLFRTDHHASFSPTEDAFTTRFFSTSYSNRAIKLVSYANRSAPNARIFGRVYVYCIIIIIIVDSSKNIPHPRDGEKTHPQSQRLWFADTRVRDRRQIGRTAEKFPRDLRPRGL